MAKFLWGKNFVYKTCALLYLKTIATSTLHGFYWYFWYVFNIIYSLFNIFIHIIYTTGMLKKGFFKNKKNPCFWPFWGIFPEITIFPNNRVVIFEVLIWCTIVKKPIEQIPMKVTYGGGANGRTDPTSNVLSTRQESY